MEKNEKPGYFSTLAKTAPVFGLKAVLGDLPKGSIEHTTEVKLRGSRARVRDLLGQGIKGRGGGRAMGAGIGILTAPIFLKGLRDVGSKDPEKRRSGLALLGSTAATYQGQKGFIEGYRSAKARSLGKAVSVKSGLALGGTRVGYKTPAAIALGLSIASGRKRSKRSGSSKYTKFIMPALSGAALGALSRGGESIIMGGIKGAKRRGFIKTLKRAAPAAGGGAAGGLLGGLVLSAAVDGAMKAMKKESSSMRKEADVATGAAIGKGFLSMLGHGLPYGAGWHVLGKAGMGYGKLGRSASKTRGSSKGVEWLNRVKTRQLAMGIREGIAGRGTLGWRTGVTQGAVFGEAGYNRAMGIQLGGMLRGVPPAYREEALLAIKKRIRPSMRYSKIGEPTPVWNQLPDAIDMAVGKSPLFKDKGSWLRSKKLTKAYNELMYGGRGAYSQEGRRVTGLPRALAKDVKPSKVGPSVALGLAGLGMGIPAAMAGGAALPLAGVGAHMLVGGAKGVLANTGMVQRQALKSAGEGIQEAFFPMLKKPLSRSIRDHGYDIGFSPATRDFGRQAGGAARGLVEYGRAGIRGKLQKGVNRMVSPKKVTFSDAATAPILMGASSVGVDKLRRDGGVR